MYRQKEATDSMGDSSTNKMLGEFFTPQKVVKTLHKVTAEVLGKDFYDEYVVWDPAWGTGNLTKDYMFKHLYCSTIRNYDLRRARMNNAEATKFQYDFLNDDIEPLESLQNKLTHTYKMPEALELALESNQKILFLMNPPYAGNGEFGTVGTQNKGGVAQNKVQELLSERKLGGANTNLYTQFLARILEMKKVYGIDNVAVAVICPPQWLSVRSNQEFRKLWFDNFKYEQGRLINAGEFDNVTDKWGISISVWTPGKTEDRTGFVHEIISYDDAGNEVSLGKKRIYNLDGRVAANEWAREISEEGKENTPLMSSGCKWKETGTRGVKGALGYMGSKANNIYHNQSEVVIVSGAYSDGCGIPIREENFDNVVMYFTARKIMIGNNANWINDKDEYCRPLLESTDEKVQAAIRRLKTDGLVYTVFNNSCHSASLENVQFTVDGVHERKRVRNNFFWLTKQKLAELHTNAQVGIEDNKINHEDDCITATKIQEYINNGELSQSALDVLEYANKLYVGTLKYRKDFKSDGKDGIEDYQVNNWDCGWYQIKQIVKQKFPDDWKEFCRVTRDFGEELKDCIYTSGMLY